jgi:DNA repair exonuclease SbcCD nuclease subunit
MSNIKYRIIITADSHLNRRFPQEVELFRVNAHNEAFRQIVDYAINEKVNAILHCGDLFDISRPWPTVVDFVKESLFKLSKNNISFYIIRGNHDGAGTDKDFIIRGSAIEYAKLPNIDNFHYIEPILDLDVSQNDRKENIGYEIFNNDLLIWGCGYYGKSTKKVLDKILDKDKIKSKFSILLLHCFVQDFNDMGFTDEINIPATDIEKYPFKIVAIGHNHRKVDPTVRHDITFLSPGSPEMWDFFKPVGFGFFLLTIFDDFSFDLDYKNIEPMFIMKNIVINSSSPKSADWYESEVKKETKLLLAESICHFVTKNGEPKIAAKPLILNFQLKGKLVKDSGLVDCEKIRKSILENKNIIYANIDDRINLDLDIVDITTFKSGVSTAQIEELLKSNLTKEEVDILIDGYNAFNKELDDDESITKTGNLKTSVFDSIKQDIETKLLGLEIKEDKKEIKEEIKKEKKTDNFHMPLIQAGMDIMRINPKIDSNNNKVPESKPKKKITKKVSGLDKFL